LYSGKKNTHKTIPGGIVGKTHT